MSLINFLNKPFDIQIQHHSNAQVKVELKEDQDGVCIYECFVEFPELQNPLPITLRWKLPAINVKGLWKSGSLYEKRIQYDWELEHVQSRVSVNAPVVNIFGHQDENILTFACEDASNMIEMNALLREEDNHLYCHITFFKELHPAIKSYRTQILIDRRTVKYYESLQDVSNWWAGFERYQPASVPALAKSPLYSTWYNFHQDMDEQILIEECKIAKKLGYDFIIIDDGWQTSNTNRGYDFTGDWEPERFPDMKGFVGQLHEIGMQVGLWYSVPFCGKKSKAYQQFKGKFLTESHRWAPVFDPRYPEVRAHLIEKYTQAVRDWGVDALKLDFIDDFKVYEETILTQEDGRDFANVNAAVDCLFENVMKSLKLIKPDIAIEFRQEYIGPNMRKYGNMFRAFDAPNDPVSNRIRVTDVKLLCGNSAAHSDMLTWHEDEPVEIAALQLLSAFFGVPQMSVNLRLLTANYLDMICFYNSFWKEVADVIMQGKFKAFVPISNYPVLTAELAGHLVMGLYENWLTDLQVENFHTIDLLNGKMTELVLFQNLGQSKVFQLTIWDCQGNIKRQEKVKISEGVATFQVPSAGRLRLQET